MTTTFYLIRHGAHDWLAKGIAGRLPNVHLNAHGREQAETLADRLARVSFAAVYASPLERAQETAEPIARCHNLPITTVASINEMHFGDWTGQSFDALAGDPFWPSFNTFRSGTRPPGPGAETMAEVQMRMIGAMERLRRRRGGARLALVGHGDPIRAAVAYFLGIPLDLMARIEIEPASVSVVALADWGPRVLRVNDTGEFAHGGGV